MEGFDFSHMFTYGMIVVVIVMLVFAFWVTIEGKHQSRYIAFASIISSVALWLLSFSMWRLPTAGNQSAFWFNSMYAIGSFIPAFYYVFSLTYLLKQKISGLIWFLSLMPSFIIAFLVYGNDAVARNLSYNFSLFGGSRLLFAIHFSLFVVAALGVLFFASRKSKKENQKEMFPIIAGTLISFYTVFGTLYVSKSIANVNYIIDAVALVSGVIIIIPFIIKRRLLVDLRLVGAEILIMVALFVFVVDIVASSESMFDFIFRLTILILLIFYGAMTTKAFVHEIKQLQRSEAMQEQIIRMNGRLIEADRLKTKFVSLVAHQMRSPLTSMHIYLNMARSGEFGKVNKKLDDVLKTNMEMLERLMKTSKTFLDVTRIETGRLDLYKAETDIIALIKRLVSEVQPLANEKKLEIKVKTPETLPSCVCDAGAIFHILMNFVDNAIKYTEKGRIEIEAKLVDNNLEIMVTDTGIGMTDEDLGSLFRIFERGMSAVRLQSRGEGLGLFIAKQFIEAHNGQVIVESKGRGEGSKFGFIIPINN